MDVTDFLLALCGAVGSALAAEHLLGRDDPLAEGVWQRFSRWLQTDVSLKELSFKDPTSGASLKAELKSNPTFRQRLQRHLAGAVGHLVQSVRSYLDDCLKALRKRHSDAVRWVVLVDSIEHARGTSANEPEVHAALERLFATHDELRFPGLHLVYTVPPWLRIQRPNIGSLYDGEGLYLLPSIKVREVGDGEAYGAEYAPGVDYLVEVVSRRGDWRSLLGEPQILREIILITGGHLRDLIRLLGSITLRGTHGLPVSPEIVESAANQLREQMLPIPTTDALWLARIARSRQPELPQVEQMGTLARYFDGHLVLTHRNGRTWYDVHPLVRDHVLALAKDA